MKKTTLLSLLCLCLSLLAASALADADWGYTFTYGDWECYANENGTVSISYKGDATHVYPPESVRGKPVESINDYRDTINKYMCAQPGSIAAKALSKRGEGFTVPGYDDIMLQYLFAVDEQGHPTDTVIGVQAKAHDTYIETAIFPDYPIDAIAQGGFSNCTSLKRIEVPEGVTRLERGAFHYCELLEEVSLPDSLRYIRTEAFVGCSSLREIDLPDDIAEMDFSWGIFEYGSQYVYAALDSETAKTISKNSHVFNLRGYPDVNLRYEIENDEVTELIATAHTLDITQAVIPEGVTVIGVNGFANCEKMSHVKFPSTLREINDEAFVNCTAVPRFELPYGLLTLGSMNPIFSGCPKTTEVVLPDSLTSISYMAFSGTELTIIANCNLLKDGILKYPFKTSLKLTHKGEGIEVPGYAPNRYNSGLSTGVKCSLCGRMIVEQVSIMPLRLPEGLKRIESGAFLNVAEQAILLPKDIVYIAADAFSDDAILYYPENSETETYCKANANSLPECLPYK